jgi:hypothetical protein
MAIPIQIRVIRNRVLADKPADQEQSKVPSRKSKVFKPWLIANRQSLIANRYSFAKVPWKKLLHHSRKSCREKTAPKGGLVVAYVLIAQP